MSMVGHLQPPVLIVELFVLVAVGEDAGLAEQLEWTALPAQATDLSGVWDWLSTFSAGGYVHALLERE